MFEIENARYTRLNNLAKKNETVIFGCGSDCNIPISELKTAFEIEDEFYNRSAEGISIIDAVEYYKTIIEPLEPRRIIIHIGEMDRTTFEKSTESFDNAFRELIQYIRSTNPKCKIGIVSQRNQKSDYMIESMNSHLRMIADSEGCEYEDISQPCLWNPVEIKKIMSIEMKMGVHRQYICSLSDLCKIFFCYEKE